MENQAEKLDNNTGSEKKENMPEVGSNLTGTARPATPDEKELISHHMNKNSHQPKGQHIDSFLGSANEKS